LTGTNLEVEYAAAGLTLSDTLIFTSAPPTEDFAAVPI
jgi:hypothetical protein